MSSFAVNYVEVAETRILWRHTVRLFHSLVYIFLRHKTIGTKFGFIFGRLWIVRKFNQAARLGCIVPRSDIINETVYFFIFTTHSSSTHFSCIFFFLMTISNPYFFTFHYTLIFAYSSVALFERIENWARAWLLPSLFGSYWLSSISGIPLPCPTNMFKLLMGFTLSLGM